VSSAVVGDIFAQLPHLASRVVELDRALEQVEAADKSKGEFMAFLWYSAVQLLLPSRADPAVACCCSLQP
jgi:hypothetical protein